MLGSESLKASSGYIFLEKRRIPPRQETLSHIPEQPGVLEMNHYEFNNPIVLSLHILKLGGLKQQKFFLYRSADCKYKIKVSSGLPFKLCKLQGGINPDSSNLCCWQTIRLAVLSLQMQHYSHHLHPRIAFSSPVCHCFSICAANRASIIRQTLFTI